MKFLEDSGIDPTDERLQGQTSPVKRSDSVTERPRSQVRKDTKHFFLFKAQFQKFFKVYGDPKSKLVEHY